MMLLARTKLYQPDARVVTWALLAVYIALALVLLAKDYLFADTITLLGLALAPFLLIVRQAHVYSYRYGILAALCWLLSWLAPVKTLQYVTLVFSLLFLLEIRLGKLNELPLLLLLIISPIFRYVTDVFSFPIRLTLSQWAGKMLGLMHKQVAVQGNVISLNGDTFAVDPACMGLQSVAISYVLTLFFLAHHERKVQRHLPKAWLGLVLMGVMVLVTLANLSRIVLLVQFGIPPSSLMHDAIGMACLVVYVILPVSLIIRGLFQVAVPVSTKELAAATQPPLLSVVGPFLLLVGVMGQQLFLPSAHHAAMKPTFDQLPGYQISRVKEGIWKFEKEEALVYVKPLRSFYSTEHSPIICWQGSGYTFSQIKEQSIGGKMLYVGTLKKGKDTLYAAWWFDNGRTPTISQWEWRWQMARGGPPFSLVNVNAASVPALQREVEAILRRNTQSMSAIKAGAVQHNNDAQYEHQLTNLN